MRPAHIGAVVNPHAGGDDAAALFAELADCFPTADADSRITTGSGDVPDAARELAEEADLLAVIGGDGTVREVASALVGTDSDTPLFIVPAGRGNSTYRHLYGDADWQDVARGIARRMESLSLDVGRVESDPAVEERYFVLGFTAGLFRDAVVNAERFRALPGPLAYVLATGQAVLVDDPVRTAVEVDGEPFFDGAARLVAVGGGRFRGSDFELFPSSRPSDGTLHVAAIEPVGHRESVRIAALARDGRLHEHPAVRYATAEAVMLRSPTGLPVEVDGTPIGTALSAARIEVVPGALSFAAPA